MNLSASAAYVCPLTQLPLVETTLDVARAAIAAGQHLSCRVSTPGAAAPIGETSLVMLRSDSRAAFPVVDNIPILLGPEILTSPQEPARFNLVSSHYAEAYNETPFYDAEAGAKAEQITTAGALNEMPYDGLRGLGRLHRLSAAARAEFPNPPLRWISSRMDSGSEWDCYSHLAPIVGKRVMQLGGTGEIALSFLLAGARGAILVTPMLGEARLALKLAQTLGLAPLFQCVIGIAEEIPMPDASTDIVFSGGCVHHMTTELAFPQIARVLTPGGKFAAVEPWRAPLYGIGTKLFGKREANPFCRPLNRDRVAPLFTAFENARYVQHGALTRYPMLALQQLGANISRETAWAIGQLDDRLCSFVPGLRGVGSGVSLLATK